MGAMLDKLMAPMPDIRTLIATEARIVIALRLAIIAHKTERDCRDRLDRQLGNKLVTTRFLILMETVGMTWPDPFQIGRPCCPLTTLDEILFLNMVRHSASRNRLAFDVLLGEMIDDSGRERIYRDIRNFLAAFA